MPLVRVPDVAQEHVAGQEAAPRARVVPVGRAAPERRLAPAEEVLGGRAPPAEVFGGPAPVGPGPREQEPGSWEPERRARVVAVRSAAAMALAVSVSLGGLAVPIPATAERDWSADSEFLSSPIGRFKPGLGPFVVLFGKHRPDETDQGTPVGEDPDHVGAAAYLLVWPLLYPALGGRATRCGASVQRLRRWSRRGLRLHGRTRQNASTEDAGHRCADAADVDR